VHPVLFRQLRKLGLAEEVPPTAAGWSALIARVGASYEQADQDRYLVERSLEVSSTEMRDLHDALRAAEKRTAGERDRLQAVLTSIDAGVCVLDRAGAVASINPVGAALLGGTESSITGLDFASIVAPGDFDLVRAVAAGVRQRCEKASFRRLDGGPLPVSYAVGPLMGDGAHTGSVIVFADIWERLRSEAALESSERRARQSEEMFRQMAEAVNQVYWVTEPGPRLLYVSPAFDRIFGRPAADVLRDRRVWVESIHPDDRERVVAAAARETEGTYDELYRVVRPDGSTRWIRDRAFPVREPDGRATRVYGVAEDVTDLRSAEELLRQAQKMDAIGRLAGGVAHDINNVLTVVRGYAEMTRCTLNGTPHEASVAEILRAVDRAAALTQRLLSFSRRQPAKLRVVDLGSLVDGLAPMLRTLIGEHVRLTTTIGARDLRTLADSSQLEQVVVNLVVNARDAMPLGGNVQVALTSAVVQPSETSQHLGARAGRHAVLHVRDDGCGMDQGTLQHVFEPFFTTKPDGKGTGLGLAIVFGIVQQVGGHVRVQSAPGAGSTFSVYLPIHGGEVEPAASVDARPCEGGSETILLAEDDPQLREMARRILSARGYHVLAAGSGREAVTIARAHTGPINLLVSDVVMPEMNGRELAATLTAERPGLLTLHMSGYTDDAALLEGMRVGTVPFLEKPFAPDLLLQRVRACLDRGRPASPARDPVSLAH
jgi:two-component system, cell cycle sensor histidine kinase and response regulator CckA